MAIDPEKIKRLGEMCEALPAGELPKILERTGAVQIPYFILLVGFPLGSDVYLRVVRTSLTGMEARYVRLGRENKKPKLFQLDPLEVSQKYLTCADNAYGFLEKLDAELSVACKQTAKGYKDRTGREEPLERKWPTRIPAARPTTMHRDVAVIEPKEVVIEAREVAIKTKEPELQNLESREKELTETIERILKNKGYQPSEVNAADFAHRLLTEGVSVDFSDRKSSTYKVIRALKKGWELAWRQNQYEGGGLSGYLYHARPQSPPNRKKRDYGKGQAEVPGVEVGESPAMEKSPDEISEENGTEGNEDEGES